MELLSLFLKIKKLERIGLRGKIGPRSVEDSMGLASTIQSTLQQSWQGRGMPVYTHHPHTLWAGGGVGDGGWTPPTKIWGVQIMNDPKYF